MNCKNCGEVISGSYCSHCGQASKVEKITLSTLTRDFSEDVLQVNKGFFYTITQLFTRPGHSIREYLDGKRKIHYRPITYLVVLSTLYFLIAKLTGSNTWMNDAIEGFVRGANDTNGESEISWAVTFLADNYAYTTLLLLPVFAFASYICFPKKDINYLEHIVLNAFITGQQAIIYALAAGTIGLIDNDILESIPIFTGILYCFWVFYQFFDRGNRLINIVSTISSYILYIVFSSVLFFIVIGVSEGVSW